MTARQPQQDESRELITMKQARELTGNCLSLRTLGRMAERGEFKAAKVGRRWIINRESFLKTLEDAL